jgi:hypothetical protein
MNLNTPSKAHITMAYSSLDKAYNKAKLTGKLMVDDIYVLEAINKITLGFEIGIEYEQLQALRALYNTIMSTSEYVCVAVDKYDITYASADPTFTQAEQHDCNSYTVYDDIYYWQEEDYTITNSDMVEASKLTGFTTGKSKDTRSKFVTGKSIDYTFIGRLGFFIINALSTDVFKIYDENNADVTTGFTITYITENKSMLITSNNIYSYGAITFKIKKI